MDFEEQLEKAEKLSSPSLVGASLRSADDSPHNNYIHPEKSVQSKKKHHKKSKSSILNSSIGASLDDLISEGALIGSEEDFTKYLDDDGNVRDDAKFLAEEEEKKERRKSDKLHQLNHIKSELASQLPADSSPLKSEIVGNEDNTSEPEVANEGISKEVGNEDTSKAEVGNEGTFKSEVGNEGTSKVEVSSEGNTIDQSSNDHEQPSDSISKSIIDNKDHNDKKSSFYQQSEDYSTPNLSEYQLDNQINDHQHLLNTVKSLDHNKLPRSSDREVSKSNAPFTRDSALQQQRALASSSSSFSSQQKPSETMSGLINYAARHDKNIDLHTPYFQSDPDSVRPGSRSTSRARSSSQKRVPEVSDSRSSTPHLARGDSYKNVHSDTPSTYELPADLSVPKEQDDEDDDRRTRQSKPTMGESIAAAEAKAKAAAKQQAGQDLKQSDLNAAAAGDDRAKVRDVSLTRDPSLVTTGDYTNFNADQPDDASLQNPTQNLYSTRSQSSTNYLRSISRSRSRQPGQLDKNDLAGQQSVVNEKNDADPKDLVNEGALVTEDPYDQIGGLDTMVENVLEGDEGKSTSKPESSTTGDANPTNDQKVTGNKNVAKNEAIDTESTKDSSSAKDESLQTIKGDDDLADVIGDAKSLQRKHNEEEAKQVKEDESEDNKAQKAQGDEAKEVKRNEIEDVKQDDSKDAKQNQTTNSQSEDHPASSSSMPDEGKTLPADNNDIPLAAQGSLAAEAAEAVSTTAVVNDPKDDDESIEKETHEAVSETPKHDDKSTKTADAVAGKTDEVGNAISGELDEPSKADAKQATDNTVNDSKTEVDTKSVDDKSDDKSVDDQSAEIKQKETKEQLVAEAAPSVSSKDIKTEKSSAQPSKETSLPDPDVSDSKENQADAVTPKVALPQGDKNESDPIIEQSDTITAKDIKTESSSSDAKEAVEKKEADQKDSDEATQKASTSTEKKPEAEAEQKETKTLKPEPTVADSKASEGADSKSKAAVIDDEDLDFDISPEELRKHLESQPVYIFTSYAGGMQIIPRTNRLVTILQANGIKFEVRDLGTDPEAKKIWKRGANGKTLPGVVRGDDYIGNWQEIDEANEEYKLSELLYETL